jgi:hypothetical protein
MAFGVFAGATIIDQATASKPGTPASAIGGISGAAGQRVSEDTPSATNLLSLIGGSEGTGSENISGTCPARTSVVAGALPL